MMGSAHPTIMHWKFPEHILITPIEPEAALLNTLTGANYVLNPLGLAICASIQEGCNERQAIVDRISQYFPDHVGTIPADVMDFITALQTERLIEVVADD
jgi:Coenzyme PQQ synthesis protein D (PqqD)